MAEEAEKRKKELLERRDVLYEQYQAATRSVRTWFIVYGVGAPALMISSGAALQKFTASKVWATIAFVLFGMGALIQMIGQVATREAYRKRLIDLDLAIYSREGHLSPHPKWVKRARPWAGARTDCLTLLLFFVASVIAAGILIFGPSPQQAQLLPATMPAFAPAGP